MSLGFSLFKILSGATLKDLAGQMFDITGLVDD